MDTPIVPPGGSARAAPSEPAPVPRQAGTLYRDEVLAVVDGGLGLFLQHVGVDVHLVDGHFRGFRILRLAPPDYWQGVDLKPGDVVESINGMNIERPLEAHAAFSSLKTADQLVVSYSRGGERRELVYQIKSRPGATQPPTTRPAQPAPAPAPPAQSDS